MFNPGGQSQACKWTGKVPDRFSGSTPRQTDSHSKLGSSTAFASKPWSFSAIADSKSVDEHRHPGNYQCGLSGEDNASGQILSPMPRSIVSWPQENFYQTPAYNSNKRRRSPSNTHDRLIKRPVPLVPEDMDNSILLDNQQHFEGYAHEQGGREENVGLGISYSYEDHMSSRRTFNVVGSRWTSSPLQQSFPYGNASYLSPVSAANVEHRNMQPFIHPQSQLPAYQVSSQSMSNTNHQRSGHQNPAQMLPSKRRRAEYEQSTANLYCKPEQLNFQRAHSAAPKARQHRDERANERLLSPLAPVSSHPRKPQLRSPIWANKRTQKETSDIQPMPCEPKVKGRYVVRGDPNRELGSEVCYANSPQRARSRSVHPRSPINYGPRSRSMHRPTRRDHTTRDRTVSPQIPVIHKDVIGSRAIQAPSFKDLASEYGELELQYSDHEDATPMEQLFRKSKYQGQQGHAKLDDSLYSARNVLPNVSISYKYRPKSSLVNNKRPKLSSAKSWSTFGRSSKSGRPESPVVISLLSSPEASIDIPPPKNSMPMKQRLAPPKKRSAPRPSTKPRTAFSDEKTGAKEHLNELYQRRCADHIVGREDEELQKAIFGEIIGLNLEDQVQQAETARAEARHKHEVKMNEILAKEETARLAEIKKKELHDQAVKRARLEKEQQEEKKQIKREAERKKQLALDAKAREEKRKKAEKIILDARAREQAEVEKRDRERERARTAYEDMLKLELMKAELEIKRLQAASLISAKTPSSEEPRKPAAKAPSHLTSSVEDEDTLFIPEDSPKVACLPTKDLHTEASIIEKFLSDQTRVDGADNYDINGPLLKSIGPRSAAQLFSQSNTDSKGPNTYQAVREKHEAQGIIDVERKSQASIRENMTVRFNSKSEPPESPMTRRLESLREKPKPSYKSCLPLMPKTTPNKPQDTFFTLSRPPAANNPTELEQNCTDSKTFSQQSAPAALTRPSPLTQIKVHTSEGRLITNFERARLDNHAKELKDAANRKRNEDRRKKDSEKLRDSKRQKLMDEAKKGGFTLSEKEINFRVETYMVEREARYQKQQAKKAAKEGREYSALVTEPESQATPQSWSSPLPETQHLIEDKQENEDPDTKARRMRELEMKESLAAIRRVRGWGYAQAAAKKTVRSFQYNSEESGEESEVESEEDPDDEPTLESLLAPSKAHYAHQDSYKSFEERCVAGDGVHNPVEVRSLTVSHAPNQDDLSNRQEEEGSIDTIKSKFPGLSNDPQDVIQSPTPPSLDPTGYSDGHIDTSDSQQSVPLKIYFVMQSQETDDVAEGDPTEMIYFADVNKANKYASDQVCEFRQKLARPQSVVEKYNSDELFWGCVKHDNHKSTTIWVKSGTQLCSELPNSDPFTVTQDLLEKYYYLFLTTMTEVFDEETQSNIQNTQEILVPGSQYSDLETANYAASDYLYKYIKPNVPRLAFIEQHQNNWDEALRNARDECNKTGQCFDCTLERDDEQLQWITERSVSIRVGPFAYQNSGI